MNVNLITAAKNAVEKSLCAAIPHCGRQRFSPVRAKLFLLSTQVRWRHHLDCDDHIATPAALQPWHAQPAHRNRAPRLCSHWNINILLSAFQRRHLHRCPQGSLANVDRQIDMHIKLVACKDRMGINLDHDIEITGRATQLPCFAFTRQTNARAIIYASRNLDIDLAVDANALAAIALGTG